MPDEILWEADPHTLAKIRIVEEYLKAWIPIVGLSSKGKKISYIDAFSGPGQYAKGEKGSPVVALETALKHRQPLDGVDMKFIFIDKDPKRVEHLKGILKSYQLPSNIECKCLKGTFDETLTWLMDQPEEAKANIAPTFLFIDPFGISQTPLQVIKRFMRNPKCEVLINFMYQFVNRFKSERPEQLDVLLGTTEWREVDKCATPAERERFFVSLYERQLKTVAKFTWAFRMLDRKNQTSYYLFYATNHPYGLEKMKDAMWKVSPSGDYSFSDRHAHQLFLFGDNPDLLPLREDLLNIFRGKTISIEELVTHVILRTNYLKSHLKTRTLVPMEKDGLIEVVTPRKKSFTYPPGTRIKFRE